MDSTLKLYFWVLVCFYHVCSLSMAGYDSMISIPYAEVLMVTRVYFEG